MLKCDIDLEPHVLCACSGFICSCCYWKWIPGAIWIQLIQLNAVNNWSDSETELCHMGAVTSSFKGWNGTPVQLDCPGLFVPQSVHCIWLPPVKDTKQTMRTHGEVTLALWGSARLCKDNRLTDSRGPETREIVTCCSTRAWVHESSKLLSDITNKSLFVSLLIVCLSFRLCASCSCFACYDSHAERRPPYEPDGLCMGWLSSWPWNKVQIGAIFGLDLGGSLDCNI